MTTKEKTLGANALTKYVIMIGASYGFVLWRNNNGAVYDIKRKLFRKNPQHKKGVFDVIGFEKKTGRHCEFEIKIGYDKMSIYQEEHLKELKTNNCHAAMFKTEEDIDHYFSKKVAYTQSKDA